LILFTLDVFLCSPLFEAAQSASTFGFSRLGLFPAFEGFPLGFSHLPPCESFFFSFYSRPFAHSDWYVPPWPAMPKASLSRLGDGDFHFPLSFCVDESTPLSQMWWTFFPVFSLAGALSIADVVFFSVLHVGHLVLLCLPALG